jgi:hypothetical protein
LSSTTLDRVLLDALSDLYADVFRREQSPTDRDRHFRDRLEKAVEAATGISLCGLPTTIRQAVTLPASDEPECGFCHGESVLNAAEWLGGGPCPPASCPRCGKTAESENVPVPLAAVASPHRSRDEGGAHSGHAYGEQR